MSENKDIKLPSLLILLVPVYIDENGNEVRVMNTFPFKEYGEVLYLFLNKKDAVDFYEEFRKEASVTMDRALYIPITLEEAFAVSYSLGREDGAILLITSKDNEVYKDIFSPDNTDVDITKENYSQYNQRVITFFREPLSFYDYSRQILDENNWSDIEVVENSIDVAAKYLEGYVAAGDDINLIAKDINSFALYINDSNEYVANLHSKVLDLFNALRIKIKDDNSYRHSNGIVKFLVFEKDYDKELYDLFTASNLIIKIINEKDEARDILVDNLMDVMKLSRILFTSDYVDIITDYYAQKFAYDIANVNIEMD